jgi:rhodanese-related sulfurtransferase
MDAHRITPAEVKLRVERGERVLFVDVRNPKAWAASPFQLPGAVRIPLDEIANHLADLPRDRTIVTYCT